MTDADTTPAGGGRVLTRQLCSARGDGWTLLDAVAIAEGEVRLFFGPGTETGAIEVTGAGTIAASGSAGGAPWLSVRLDQAGPFDMRIAGQEVRITPARTDAPAFEGANALVATRNGESAGIVLDWLAYHADLHEMTAAVIFDRARPGQDADFTTALEVGLAERGLACTAVVVTAPVPLGREGTPPEAHPFSVPEAPGKDRMKLPPADPWTAPLAQPLIYEVARARFLSEARAVANVEVCDLILPAQGETVFDRAVKARGGVIALTGRHAYPWRVRKGAEISFGDHICVQFDTSQLRQRWCAAPAKMPEEALWRMLRIANTAPADIYQSLRFYRFMALRHPTPSVSKIVPKSSLIEDHRLIDLAATRFGHKPVRMPEVKADHGAAARGARAIVTTMKNEGPFILEWIAYHRAIGFNAFLVYTNDCTDGTDALLDVLQAKGIVQHRDNPYRESGLKPQHAALQAAEDEALIRDAAWIVCMDVDEYIDIKTGDGTLDALFAAVPDANMISMTWRLFGNSDVHAYEDRFILEQFDRCAPELVRKPHQAWGFKTLFKNIGLFKKLGVHRPKGLNPQLWEDIAWVNGSGKPLPRQMFRNAWRSTAETYGYGLVSLNHYAVRSAESFLVKRDRGRVNHVDRDQGLSYWFRMNHNVERERSIQRMLPALRAEYDRLMAHPDIAACHAACVAAHRNKIAELKAAPNYAAFYAELTGRRLEKLSRLLPYFGANVFLSGPGAIPDSVVDRDPGEQFFFTVEKGETAH